MPFYEYECGTCQTRFERLVQMSETNSPACPSCGAEHARKLISVIGGMVGAMTGTGTAQAPPSGCGGGACGNC